MHNASSFIRLELAKGPIQSEATARIDALLAIERKSNGLKSPQRVLARSQPLLVTLEPGCASDAQEFSKNSDTGNASTTASSVGLTASSMIAAHA
jgi:hypothetical protein